DWDDDGGSGRRRSTIRRLAPWIALLVILTPLLIGGLYIYNIYENKYHPADYSGAGTGSVTVQVNSGDSASSLGPRLQSLGVVASARAFVLAAEHTTSTTSTGAPPQLEAGFYKLHMHMQASLAWAALLNPKNRVQLTVTIPEGKRASQVVLILAKETSIPASQFQAVINSPAQLGLPSYAKGKVEGYLFPATYTIQPNETAAQILKAMVQRYDIEAQAIKISSAATAVHLSSAQVIIEASLAQAEGGSVSDYPKIARVIANRLAIGMHLQFDSTVLYGLGKYAVSATIAETRTPGPYNTYLNAGLPVGPICNPGNAAIQAVLHPASGNWLYFLTKPGGASEFSTTPLQGQ
ncbi:MAG: endolytic transglycosylase MltG, partial [Trebonia sp.]